MQISAISQDIQGYLWVATRAGGVGRFDGLTWKTFDSSSGLPSSGVEALDISPGGTLYLGTNGGAARREGNSWVSLKTPPGIPRLPVTHILAQSDTRIWIGTDGGLWSWRGPQHPAERVIESQNLNGSRITYLARGSGDIVWVGTSSGLQRINPQGPIRLEPVSGLPPYEIQAVAECPGRGLLVSVLRTGLFYRKLEGGDFMRLGDDTIPGRFVTSICVDKNNPDIIWMGTSNRGVFRYDGHTWTRFGVEEGFPKESINAIFQDREDVLWFGTAVGLIRRGPAAFAAFGSEDGFPDKGRFYGMTESRDGDLWFSAYEDGLFRLRKNGTFRKYTSRDGLPRAPVSDVEADPAGGVWISSEGGLARIDGDRVRLVELPTGGPTNIRTLLAAPDGTLYIGGYHEGLFSWRAGRLQALGPPVGRSLYTLWRGRDGDVWCGGSGWGAVHLRPNGSFEVITKAGGLPSDQVNYIFEDSRGSLWISTECGAWRRDLSGQTRIYDLSSGLPDSFVYWTVEDHEGAIWFGTNHGATRMNQSGRFETYTSLDGLAGDECNEDGVLVDSRGRLFISGEGVATFLGRPVHRIPPPIWLEEVRVGDKLESPDKVVLSPGQGPLVFKLSAPTFLNEESTRIRYRLIGLSETWNLSEITQRVITFGGLGPGRYLFQAAALTGDGLESEKPVVVSVQVPPRWWQSSVFIGLMIVLAVMMIFVSIRIRERRLEQTKRRLESQVKLRTDELRLANDRLAELAIKDDLTDLPNRRAVLDRLREAMSGARRHSQPLVVAMIDVNNFKEVNDRLGHEVGDTVLRKIAAAMRLAQRHEDTLGRYGGDEFLAVMPGCDESSALHVIERLKKAVASVQIKGTESLIGSRGFSISIGIAAFDDSTPDERDLVRRADEALYRTKAALTDNGQ